MSFRASVTFGAALGLVSAAFSTTWAQRACAASHLVNASLAGSARAGSASTSRATAGRALGGWAARGRSPAQSKSLLLGVPLTETSWLISGSLPGARHYRLASEPLRPLMGSYLEPGRTRTPEWQVFYRGSYGPNRRAWLPELCWANHCDPTAVPLEQSFGFRDLELYSEANVSDELGLMWREDDGARFWPGSQGAFGRVLQSPWSSWSQPSAGPWQDTGLRRSWSWPLSGSPHSKPELLEVVRTRPCPRTQLPLPVRVVRYAGEVEKLELMDCDGAIATEALERLSVLARPPRAPRPELPLPLYPQGEFGEWTPEVRMLHPRLAWLVAQIARAFPSRSVVLMSGYRRDAHGSLHQKGQALDLYVQGVPNEDLFRFCRSLNETGCGYYPNHPFVHVDIRPFGKGHVAWVDVSDPGEPSVYVDGWPGVLAPGSSWLGPPS